MQTKGMPAMATVIPISPVQETDLQPQEAAVMVDLPTMKMTAMTKMAMTTMTTMRGKKVVKKKN
eukprot:12067144-Karenia_brevis.AAC.1